MLTVWTSSQIQTNQLLMTERFQNLTYQRYGADRRGIYYPFQIHSSKSVRVLIII